MNRRVAVGFAVLAMILATTPTTMATTAAVAAPSGTPSDPRPVGSIILRGQPAWSTLGDDIAFRLAIRSAQPGLVVRAVVHGAVLSRIAFERTLTGDRLGSGNPAPSTPVDSMAIVGTDRVFTIGTQNPDAPRDPTRQRLAIPGSGGAGVFPVVIDLWDPASEQVVDSFVTSIVAVRARRAGEEPNEPLQVAWMWRIAASPATAPNGDPTRAFTNAIEPSGRLSRIATGLGQAGGVPVTLVPNPETVDTLRRDAPTNSRSAALLGALRVAGRSSPVLAGPYTTIDGPAVMSASLGAPFSTAIALGRRTLETSLNAAVDATIAPPQPLDPPTLMHLRNDGGATRVVVMPEVLTTADAFDIFTPARPFRLDTAAGSFDALEINPTVTNLLVQRGPAALRAQQILAGLAVIALEQPNRTRGVVIDTPLLWDPDPARVTALLAGLRDHPFLQGAALVDLFETIPVATTKNAPYTRTLAPINPAAAPVTAGSYADGLRLISALAGMIGTDDPLVSRLRHELDLTLSGRVPGTGSAVSRARLQIITNEVGVIAAGVTAAESRTVTLTSRRASVPLSIKNATGRSLTVEVKLESQKLEFPNGASREIKLGPGNTTTAFDVAARASGTFPVVVTLSSPGRGIDLQRSRYTVRSSAVSGVGLVLTISAGLFLAAWWLTHWRRSRRRTAPPLPTSAS